MYLVVVLSSLWLSLIQRNTWSICQITSHLHMCWNWHKFSRTTWDMFVTNWPTSWHFPLQCSQRNSTQVSEKVWTNFIWCMMKGSKEKKKKKSHYFPDLSVAWQKSVWLHVGCLFFSGERPGHFVKHTLLVDSIFFHDEFVLLFLPLVRIKECGLSLRGLPLHQ